MQWSERLAARLSLVGPGSPRLRALWHQRHDGVQCGIDGIDAFEVRRENFARRKLTFSHESGKFDGRTIAE